MALKINSTRIRESIEKIATFHEENSPYSRRSFTDAYQEARGWLKREMQNIGLSVHIDEAGNLIGKRSGKQANLPSIVTGSHTDTVANGGRYDGIVGVMAAVEVVRALNDAGMMLNHPLEVIDFLAEEPSVFGISTVGSRGMVGHLTSSMLELKDDLGRNLSDGIRFVGGNPDKLTQPLRDRGSMKAFLELHIEQGPVLEDRNLDIGVVTGIVGIHRYKVQVSGVQGHAGTVPMGNRQDALVTGAKVVQKVQERANDYNQFAGPFVATVGTIQVSPNHANVIPGEVTLTLEFRSIQKEQLYQFADEIIKDIRQITDKDGCDVNIELLSQSEPVLSDRRIIESIEHSAHTLGLTTLRLPSGAGHDTSHVAAIAPVGMIFIPCRKGLSHHPDEFSSIEQITNGVKVLGESILAIDKQN